MPQSEDFAALEAEIADIEKQIADIDQILSDNAARIRAEYKEQQAKLRAVNDLESKRDNLVRDAQQAAKTPPLKPMQVAANLLATSNPRSVSCQL